MRKEGGHANKAVDLRFWWLPVGVVVVVGPPQVWLQVLGVVLGKVPSSEPGVGSARRAPARPHCPEITGGFFVCLGVGVLPPVYFFSDYPKQRRRGWYNLYPPPAEANTAPPIFFIPPSPVKKTNSEPTKAQHFVRCKSGVSHYHKIQPTFRLTASLHAP